MQRGSGTPMRGVSAAGRRHALRRRSAHWRRRGAPGLRALTACIGATLLVFGAVQVWHCGTEDCASHLSNDASEFARTLVGGLAASPSQPQVPTSGSPMFQSQQSEFLGTLHVPTTLEGYESMTLQDLRDRAVELGASEAAVAKARQADDAKLAMYTVMLTVRQEKQQAAEATARAVADAAASVYTEDLPLIPPAFVAASPTLSPPPPSPPP